MGTIKIELDIPEFNNVLDINISLTKDKNGVVQTTIPGPSVVVNSDKPSVEPKVTNPFLDSTPGVEEKKPSTSKKKSTGNLMGSDLF